MLRKRLVACAVGSSMSVLAAGSSFGADATAQYDTVSNPAAAGGWSYGEYVSSGAIPGGPTQLHPVNTLGAPFPASVHLWHQPFGTIVNSAFVSKNLGAVTVNQGVPANEWDPGQLVLRPGINDQAPFVRFTAPAAGTYSYTCTYAAADTVGGTRQVFTIVNGVIAASAPLNGPKGVAAPVTHSNAGIPLAAGDTIEFTVTAGGTPGDYEDDATALRNVQVNLVSPPSLKFPCTWRQPWTRPLASHDSVVRDCQGSYAQFANTCLDDFICEKNSQVKRISWWGTNPTSPGQPQRNFLIRIWEDNGQCFPIAPLYQECVRAKVRKKGKDCTGLRVYRFFATLSAPFPVVANQRYWLEIAEIDSDMDPLSPNGISSPNPGLVDFAWSAHRPIRDCPAVEQNLLLGVFNSPLFDACDMLPDDLAFTLRSRRIVISVPPFPIKPVLRLELRDAISQELLDEIHVDPDENGDFEAESDLPEGDYQVVLYGQASPGVDLGIHHLPEDGEMNLGSISLPLGDADNSGAVGFPDVTRVLSDWLTTGPYPLP